MLEKIKPFYFLILAIILGGIFFILGRLSNIEGSKTPIKIEYAKEEQTSSVITSVATTTTKKETPAEVVIPTDGPVIGSKSGKKYYFPWCGTVKRILPQNQVPFPSIEAARAAGYLPGGNCKGLK